MSPDELRAHLERRLPGGSFGTPVRLSGGLMNAVWRVPRDDSSVIAKLVTDHVAAAPEISVDPSRAGFEARALEFMAGPLAGLLPAGLTVPALLDFDEQAGVLVLQDLGPGPDLGTLLGTGEVDVELGQALGTFLGRLHSFTADRPELARAHDNAPVQATREQVQYQAVGELVRQAGLEDPFRVDVLARDLGRRLRGPGRCLVMGDLWPPSLLRTSRGWALIDWEFSHYGQPAQDLGHLLAHLWMHGDRTEDPARAAALRAFATRFVTAYDAESPLSPTDRRDLAVHQGCEVLARTLGPFRGGYLYDKADDSSLLAAATQAVGFILQAGGPVAPQ